MPLIPCSARDEEIRYLMTKLVECSPYPLRWYEQKSDKQIRAMARTNPSVMSFYKHLVDQSSQASETEVMARVYAQRNEFTSEAGKPAIMPVESTHNVVGHYELTVANRRSLRFKFVRPDGRVSNAIISKLALPGYAIERGEDTLPSNHLCLVWENGKVVIMPVGTIVGKILGSALNNPRDLVQEIYRVNGSMAKSRSTQSN